jgi:hypothetical protein
MVSFTATVGRDARWRRLLSFTRWLHVALTSVAQREYVLGGYFPGNMVANYITVGFFIAALAMLWWKPESAGAHIALITMWLIVFGLALVSLPFLLFAGFWDKNTPWGVWWSGATLVVLVIVALRNPWSRDED